MPMYRSEDTRHQQLKRRQLEIKRKKDVFREYRKHQSQLTYWSSQQSTFEREHWKKCKSNPSVFPSLTKESTSLSKNDDLTDSFLLKIRSEKLLPEFDSTHNLHKTKRIKKIARPLNKLNGNEFISDSFEKRLQIIDRKLSCERKVIDKFRNSHRKEFHPLKSHRSNKSLDSAVILMNEIKKCDDLKEKKLRLEEERNQKQIDLNETENWETKKSRTTRMYYKNYIKVSEGLYKELIERIPPSYIDLNLFYRHRRLSKLDKSKSKYETNKKMNDEIKQRTSHGRQQLTLDRLDQLKVYKITGNGELISTFTKPQIKIFHHI
ncbi:hypothetical protein SNEBB_003602 [Seison nebaliae]|nr:hypothetical protein SNEBB_003602 [Seison nebaliae]